MMVYTMHVIVNASGRVSLTYCSRDKAACNSVNEHKNSPESRTLQVEHVQLKDQQHRYKHRVTSNRAVEQAFSKVIEVNN